MNKNLTGTSPKNSIPNRSCTSISNTTNSIPKTKINKLSHKTATIQGLESYSTIFTIKKTQLINPLI